MIVVNWIVQGNFHMCSKFHSNIDNTKQLITTPFIQFQGPLLYQTVFILNQLKIKRSQ